MTQKYKKTIPPQFKTAFFPVSPMFFGLDLKTYAKIKKTTCLKRYCFCVKFGLPL